MVIVNIDDEYIEMLIKSLDSFIRHHDEYQSDMKDVIKAAELSMKLSERRSKAVANDNSADVGEDDTDPADKPIPKDHYQPLGKDPIKINK